MGRKKKAFAVIIPALALASSVCQMAPVANAAAAGHGAAPSPSGDPTAGQTADPSGEPSADPSANPT
ncbi:MAG: hypothetical protein ACRDNL_23420, partial [Spirillospora sp.]